ncbi:MAG: DUF1893 domain-containing protein [Candidatus Bathyarchaeia archaeon]|jgi:hypothetical protein|nr:DUF1893 domain-containing protein [Candidatus Bathyarchaeota archaeon A05DMB-4]MDH7594946.1 DUF1893 domain-containing protein [Candidatus Bathyarchaeota archaeon]
MYDLDIAKYELLKKDLNLVIVKKGVAIFETKSPGIGGILEAIEKFDKEGLSGSFVADRVVGRAAALLCVYCEVSAVYAVVLSRGGKDVLENNGVAFEFEDLVPNVLNKQKTDVCPFEKAVANISKPEKAYEKLKSCVREKIQAEKAHYSFKKNISPNPAKSKTN